MKATQNSLSTETTSFEDNPQQKPWALEIGLLIVFVSEFLARDLFLPQIATPLTIDLALAVEWLVLSFMLLFWIPRVERKNLASLGFGKFNRRYFVWGTVFYLLAFFAASVVGIGLNSVGLPSLQSLQPLIRGYPLPTLLGLFFTGTVLEEVFYRGYLVERLALLTNRRWTGAFASWALFTLVHLKFFGLGPTIDVSVISAALVLLYMKERSVWPCIVLHGINDALAYLIFPLVV